jgi:hypothetical protein
MSGDESPRAAVAVDAAETVAVVVPDAARATVPVAVTVDAGRSVPADARKEPEDARRSSGLGTGTGTGTGVKKHVDAGEELDAASASTIVHLRVSPPDSDVKVGDGAWQKAVGGSIDVDVPPGGVTVTARNDDCCQETGKTLKPGDKNPGLDLPLLPAIITPRCSKPNVTVRVDGKPARLDEPAYIGFGNTTLTRQTVDVEFDGTTVDHESVTVKYKDSVEVPCKLE